MSTKSFENQVAFVTGAGAGIGQATAHMLAERGAKVAFMTRSEGNLRETKDQLESMGAEVLALKGDVTEATDVAQCVEQVRDRFGRIDLVVANAGIVGNGTAAADTTLDEWDEVLAVNLSGVFYTIKFTLPSLLEQSKGAIVVLGSDSSIYGWQDMLAYTTTKHALVGMVRSVAFDYGPRGIRTNLVCPTATATDMVRDYSAQHPGVVEGWLRGVPMGRMAEQREIAMAICHLLSDEASFTNGLLYSVDGGLTAGSFSAPGS